MRQSLPEMPNWSHSEAFPIIARIIRQEYQQRRRFITSREIATQLLQDEDGQRLIEAVCHRQGNNRSTLQIAINMVAWFSQRITVGQSVWGEEFDRIKINRCWAYQPKEIP